MDYQVLMLYLCARISKTTRLEVKFFEDPLSFFSFTSSVVKNDTV